MVIGAFSASCAQRWPRGPVRRHLGQGELRRGEPGVAEDDYTPAGNWRLDKISAMQHSPIFQEHSFPLQLAIERSRRNV